MSDSFVCGLRLDNPSGRSIRLIIEPWAHEIEMDSGASICLNFDGPRPGRLGVEYHDALIVVHGFPGSSAAAFSDDDEVWRSFAPVPDC